LTLALSYRPISPCSPAGRYNNPMPESTISPSKGLRIWQQERADVDVTHYLIFSIESLDSHTFKNIYTEGSEKHLTLTGRYMCKNLCFHHYFIYETNFFVFKVIVCMMACVCVMECECVCVWVPAKFSELRLDPWIILCVGVEQSQEKTYSALTFRRLYPFFSTEFFSARCLLYFID
jgi:hypothetical protein